MTTERFDIEVQDKVARTIRSELTAIGTSARSAHSALRDVRSELAGLSGAQGGAGAVASRIREETRAANDNARAIRAETAAIREKTAALEAQARAAAAANVRVPGGSAPPRSGTPSPSRAEPLVGDGAGTFMPGARAATKELNAYSTAAGLARHHTINLAFQMQDLSMQMAMAAQSSAPLRMGLMALFQQGTQIAGIGMQSGMSWRQMGVEMLKTARIVKTVGDAELEMAAATAAAETAAFAAHAKSTAAAVAQADVEMGLARAQQATAVTAAEVAAAETALAAADVRVATTAAEAAIAREALSASQARSAAAIEASNAKTLTSLTRFGRGGLVGLTALVVGFTAAKVASSELNEEVSKNDLTKGLGLTAKEMKKLENVSVTTGDVIKGTFLALGDAIPEPIKKAYNDMKADAAEMWNTTIGAAKNGINFLIGGMVGAYRTIVQVWDKLPDAIADLFFSAVNMAIEAINNLLKAATDGINGFLATAEGAIGLDIFGELTAPQIEKVKNNYAGAAKEVGDVARKEIEKATKVDYLGMVGDRILGVTNARLQKQADALKAERTPKSGRKEREDHTAEKRAKALADANRELDSQIKLLGFYGDALERETQYQAIANSLAQKGITLSEDEEKAIRGKIQAIQDGQRTQKALNKIYEDAVVPGKEYAATLAAIDKALKDGIITEAEAARQRTVAINKLSKDTNPLYDYNKELQKAADLAGLYGRSLDDATRAQELFDKAVAAGLEKDRPGGFKDYLPQARKENRDKELDGAQASLDPRDNMDTTDFILQNHEEMYARIAELREANVISEQEASERIKNLDVALGEARIQTASSVFGQLAALQNSKVKEVAAIGKAAAVAQATIDGIAAVQAALRGPPGPPWSYAIAAATAVSTAANVSKILGIGFERGGYTGPGGTSEVAGSVHRGEFVMDAVATRNIGVPALEAMRQGARLSSAPANDNRGASPRVSVYPGAGVYTEVVERSDGEIEIIAERVARRVAPGAVAADMSNPNGRTSKAMQTNFGARRNR